MSSAHRRLTRLSTLLILLLAAAWMPACEDEEGSGEPLPPAMLVLDLQDTGGFFDNPWPSAARMLPNGSADVSKLGNPGNMPALERARNVAQTQIKGINPTSAIYFRFDHAVATPDPDPMSRLAPGSPVILVNIDTSSKAFGTRHPFHASVTPEADNFRPAHLLQLLPVPGLRLEENTRYAAIVLRSLGNPEGLPLAVNPALKKLLMGEDPGGTLGPRLAESLGPLLGVLPKLKIDPDTIAAATVFRTGEPTKDLFRWMAAVESMPTPVPDGPLELIAEYADYYAFRGTFQAPMYQEGTPPFLVAGGLLVRDAKGMLVAQRYETAPFVVAIPKGPMPAAGFPLYHYIHGTGGVAAQVLDRGTRTDPDVDPEPGSGPSMWVAQRGWGSCSMGMHLAPERAGLLSVDGYIPYNFFNPQAMRDNFTQMLMELALFRKLALSLRIDPALCPKTDASASPDGKIGYDRQHMVLSGQSLGSYLTGMLATTLGGYEGAVLTGAGGSWVEFPFGPTDPIPLKAVLELLIQFRGTEPLDRYHPVITLFDLAMGPADNIQYVPYLLRNPRHTPPHVLVIEGWDDHQVPTMLQRALVLASGVDMAGDDPGPDDAEKVSPILPWGGQRTIPYPVKGNLQVKGHGPRTAVMARYMMDDVSLEGHFVVYQLMEPRRQIQSFLKTLISDGVPTVPDGTK